MKKSQAIKIRYTVPQADWFVTKSVELKQEKGYHYKLEGTEMIWRLVKYKTLGFGKEQEVQRWHLEPGDYGACKAVFHLNVKEIKGNNFSTIQGLMKYAVERNEIESLS